jgi:hypothetical protein
MVTARSLITSTLLLLLVLSAAVAFQQPSALSSRPRTDASYRHVGWSSVPAQRISVALSAKKDTPNENEKEKSEWGLDLILVYMTPWRNPNSIFVYMFLIVYGLGKMSEAGMVAK